MIGYDVSKIILISTIEDICVDVLLFNTSTVQSLGIRKGKHKIPRSTIGNLWLTTPMLLHVHVRKMKNNYDMDIRIDVHN